jgi:acyl-CoA synthetase (AMP-forming)/AMP-acid ligase II
VRAFDREAFEQNRVVEVAAGAQEAQTLVSSGRSLIDQTLVIIDPNTRRRCPADGVGEIWVSSPSVARGYWNQPESTRAGFGNYLSDTGELFVTGRLRDVIRIGARTLYPHDIELTVERCHASLRASGGAAFVVKVGCEDRLALVQEVERAALRSLDAEEVVSRIRRVVAARHDVGVHHVELVKLGSLPRTSSGKIQRHVCRERYHSGGFDGALGKWTSPGPAGEDSEPAG